MVKTKEHLEDIFEDLGEGNLKKFKIKLRDRKEEPRVRQAAIKQVQDAQDLADLMVNTFTLNGAVPVTLEILKAIRCNELADELRKNTGDEDFTETSSSDDDQPSVRQLERPEVPQTAFRRVRVPTKSFQGALTSSFQAGSGTKGKSQFYPLQKSAKCKRRVPTETLQGAESPSGQSSSGDAEVFTPDHVQDDDKQKLKSTYRFVCPHAGQFQCSLTNLVFVMEGEGEVLYKTVSWDPQALDGLGQMQPAGPLYNIKCSAGSVSQLHLPHCEIFCEENKDGLAVAHFIGGNVEIIQPLKVTETHVIIGIRDLSSFGLVWIKRILGIPIRGQVLLFHRTLNLEMKKLNVHLLPGNVPVSEVQSRHLDKKYIETSSKCRLIPYINYSLCCQPEECEVQPKTETFDLDNFGPNYHPTFEVFLDVNTEEVRLGILDKTEGGKKVWNRRRIFLTAPSEDVEPPEHKRIPGF